MLNIFKRTARKRILFFVIADIIFVAISVWIAFLLRFEGNIPIQYISSIYKITLFAIVFVVPIFFLNKLYSFSWAYVSANEAISLFKAVTISYILLGLVVFLSHYSPRSTIFISYFLVFMFCGALRFSKRIYLRIIGQSKISEKNKTLIVGAGDAGEQILRSILSSGSSSYHPVGFVDDNPIKAGVAIHGLKVLGRISDIPQIAKKFEIKQLIIAFAAVDSKKIKEAVELGKSARIWKIKIMPPLTEIIAGKVSFKNLRDVDIEDLLGREGVVLDEKQIESFIKNRTVLITGAAGSIGFELSKQVAKFNPSLLLLLDQDETGIFNISEELKNSFPNMKKESLVADITDKDKIEKIFEKFKPEIVFHAAAYKHVPLMEENPQEAIKNNILGTKILAETSLEFSVVEFIFISTDKAVNPSSVMGATKRVGEMICQALNQKGKTRFISVRFGNVLNSRGSVIPIFREQIKKGGPVEVTHPEMKRYFMLTSEACLLVLQAGAMGQRGEVFVLDMGKPIKILDLAREMIKMSGLEPDKDIAIVFVGPRPGEKLFEEILTAEEGTVATQNKKIFTARLSQIDQNILESKIKELHDLALMGNHDEIINCFSSFVPHFKCDKMIL